MVAERVEPLLFVAWMREAARRIFADELGEDLMRDYWSQRNVHLALVRALKDTDGQSVWCRNIAAPAGTRPQSCADVLSASLEGALADLEQRYGADMSSWTWGNAHAAHAQHRPLGSVAGLSKLFDIRIPTPGDTYTINAGRYYLRDETEPFASRHAASLRAICDLANLDNSRFIHSSGLAGFVLSAFYRYLSERWAEVHYVLLISSRVCVEQG